MVTRREVLILGLAGTYVSACGGGGGSSGTTPIADPVSSSTPPPAAPSPPAANQRVYGTRIAEWTQPGDVAGASLVATADGAPAASALKLTQSVPPASCRQAVLAEVAGLVPKGTSPGFSLGFWVRNPQLRTLNFTLSVATADGARDIQWHCAADPSGGWVFLTLSPTQQIATNWRFGIDAPASVRVTQQDQMSEGPWQAGEALLFGPVYVDLAYRPSFFLTFDDGFASVCHASSATVPSGQQVLERYGFKGTLFIVPGWLNSSGVHGYGHAVNSFMSTADVLAMHAAGWAVGSHSNTHPSSSDNAGLRLLGPYGFFLSNPLDTLPAQYVTAWGIDARWRRRATQASAGSAVVVFENPHQFLVNMPIVFTDAAPPGFTPGVVYYCQSIPDPKSASFATDQGSLRNIVTASADWTGLANYRYAGAANDDSAILADIRAGIDGLTRIGIDSGSNFFALPQGSADRYVRSACIQAGIRWVRGASARGQTFAAGRPTGGGLSNIADQPGGWLGQADSIQSDGITTPSLDRLRAYVDTTVTLGACGCSYHHDTEINTVVNLDGLCACLKTKVDAKQIDVITVDQFLNPTRS